MDVLLDTNFIISCVNKRIDFIGQLQEQGFNVFLPFGVLDELIIIKNRKGTSNADKLAIDSALEIIEIRKISKISIPGDSVDDALVEMEKKGKYIATLDRGILKRISKKIIIFDAKKSVGPNS